MNILLTIHVSDFGVFKSFGEFRPSLVRHVVRLANVQAPNATFWSL
jgi:hypothetical protein